MDPPNPLSSSSSLKTTKTTLSPLSPNPTTTTTTTPTPAQTPPTRDPITCHVLDTTTGLPAAALTVSLTLLRPLGPSAPFTAQTDADGRVSRWNQPDGPSLQEIFENMQVHSGGSDDGHGGGGGGGGGRTVWELKFQTGEYYGEGRTFWPEVRVGFFVEGGGGGGGGGGGRRHYHVPLLLGPWGYTTYRGS